MPYITKNRRDALQKGFTTTEAGELCYQLQQVLNDYLADWGIEFRTIAECRAALACATSDFERRIEAPYETKKWETNGEIWTAVKANGAS